MIAAAMSDQPAPGPPPPPRTSPTASSTVPARRTTAPEGSTRLPADGPRPKLLEREMFGWVVFAVIILVAIAAAWGTYIVLRQ
jgi:hypothetical protein